MAGNAGNWYKPTKGYMKGRTIYLPKAERLRLTISGSPASVRAVLEGASREGYERELVDRIGHLRPAGAAKPGRAIDPRSVAAQEQAEQRARAQGVTSDGATLLRAAVRQGMVQPDDVPDVLRMAGAVGILRGEAGLGRQEQGAAQVAEAANFRSLDGLRAATADAQRPPAGRARARAILDALPIVDAHQRASRGQRVTRQERDALYRFAGIKNQAEARTLARELVALDRDRRALAQRMQSPADAVAPAKGGYVVVNADGTRSRPYKKKLDAVNAASEAMLATWRAQSPRYDELYRRLGRLPLPWARAAERAASR